MIYILTFLAGVAIGYAIEELRDMLTDEYDDDSQR